MSKEKQVTRVRLLRGLHSEGNKTYKPGDVFNTVADISRQNLPGLPPRFEILTQDDSVSAFQPDTIETPQPVTGGKK